MTDREALARIEELEDRLGTAEGMIALLKASRESAEQQLAALSRVQEGLREALEEAREAVIAQDWPAMLTRVDAALDAEKTNARP